MRKLFVYVILIIMCNAKLHAHELNNIRTKNLNASPDTIQLDTLLIFKGSLEISSPEKKLTENVDFKIDYLHSTFINLQIPINTKLLAKFKVLLLDIGKPYAHKDKKIIQREYYETKKIGRAHV